MPDNQRQTTTITERFKDSLEQAQARLTSLEEEAQKMFQEVLDRSKASRREMTTLINRLNGGDLFDRKMVKQWEGKARLVSADLAHRLEDLRSRVIQYAGVASRDQVVDLSKDLDKLSRKIDRLITGKKPASAKQ